MEMLDLHLPDYYYEPAEFGLDGNPESVAVWIESLPLANIEDSAKQVVQLLVELNRSDFEPELRYRHMRVLIPIVGKMIDMLRQYYYQALLPLSSKNLVKLRLSIDLANEMARGFRIIAKEITESGDIKNPKKRDLLLTSIFLALQNLINVLTDNDLTYFSEPPRLWQTMHHLYLFAVVNHLNDCHVPFGNDPEHVLSIDFIYTCALLMAICAPHHLMHGEIAKLKGLICEVAPRCALIPVRDGDMSEGGYVTDLTHDSAPRFVAARQKINSSQLFHLDVKPMIEYLEEKLESFKVIPGADKKTSGLRLQAVDGKPDAGRKRRINTELSLDDRLQRDMLERVLATLQRKSERAHQRNPILGKISLTIGLSAGHYHVSNEVAFNPELDEVKIHTGKSISSANSDVGLVPMEFEHWKNNETRTRIESGIQSPRISQYTDDVDALDIWKKVYANNTVNTNFRDRANDMKTLHATSSWTQKNISAGGMCVFCQPGQTLPVRVGEVVGYQKVADEPWWVGIVRWLRVHENQILEIGIMHLHRNAYPVAVRAIKGTGQGGEYFRALLTEPALDDKYNTILVPAAVFDQGTELVINRGYDLTYIQLTEPTLTTRSVSQFRFRTISLPEIEQNSIRRIRGLTAGNC